MNENNVNEDEDGFYTSLDKSAVNDESNYEALRHPATSKVSVLSQLVQNVSSRVCKIS
jgi:hypothetical protein